jgi:Lon protease-like protein
MMTPGDLPDTIAVFPLSGALLLPRARLPLHIFEPRYLAMLDDALKQPGRLVGMVQPRGDGNPPPLHSIGCAGRITAFSETEDGRYMITLTGICRFRLREEVTGFTPYRRVRTEWTGFERDFAGPDEDAGFARAGFLDLLGRYFEHAGLSTDWSALKGAEDELLINSLSMLCPFDAEEKQALLEAPCLKTRRETLTALMRMALHGGQGEEKVQ